MGILGLGTDIVQISRLTASIEKHGRSFLDYFLTPREQDQAPESPARRAEYYAGRWAAKEAIAKALGCGFGKKCAWQDIEISRTEEGAPAAALSGTALQTMQNLKGTRFHLSISHEKEYATAVAILEG